MEDKKREFYYQRLLELLKESEYDAVLLAPSDELEFLTGFSLMLCERFQGYFLTAKGEAFYFCNLLYADQMEAAYHGEIPVYSWFDGDGMICELTRVFEKYQLTGGKILVNQAVQAFQILDIHKALGVEFGNGNSLFEEIRIHKTEEELEGLQKAARIADEAFGKVTGFIRAGLTEGEIGDFLKEQMAILGGQNCGAMVASGPNAGYPHYCEDKRVVQKGDMIILDYGCVWNGMHSDMSRTVFVEEIKPKWGEIYDIVDAAQHAGQDAVYKGAYIPNIDYAARNVIEKAGYGGYFPYRLGHGIGYSVHEAPYIHGNNKRHLEPGMAFSVEPGIYIPGEGGVRIENIVALDLKGNPRVLNQAVREKIVCGK